MLGSYVNFKTPTNGLAGIVVAVFPLSSAKTLVELLLKRYLKRSDDEATDHKLKLSAFKETVNILVLTYIAEVANALKVKLQTGVPKFASFRNVELSKPALLRDDLRQDSLVSVGQFNISAGNKTVIGEKRPRESSSLFIKGRFIVVY